MDQVISPPEQIASGAHALGIDISRREGSTPEQDCDLFGVDFVVFGLSRIALTSYIPPPIIGIH